MVAQATIPSRAFWIASTLLASLIACRSATAGDWPGWRGPDGNGISNEIAIPLRWEPSQGIAWKTAIAGKGHSSPIICGDAVFVTTAIPEEEARKLLRINRKTGAIEWERTVLTAPAEPIHPLNSYASSTPATDGQQVFVTFLDRDQMFVAAYDFEGNKLWEQRPGPFASKHGFCTNPVLYRDSLLLNGDHDGEAYIVRLAKRDGAQIWKIPRENKTRSYCTPILLRENGQDQFLLNGSFCTAAYDCDTGKQIWICDGPSEQMVATLVVGHGLIFSLGGFPERHLLAIPRGKQGRLDDQIVWRTHQGIPYVPSPLLYGDYLHVVSDEGFYTCFEPKSGKVLSRKRAGKHFSGSLVAADQKIYMTDDTGVTKVIANGPDFQLLAENHLGEDVYASPAISQGCIFLRGLEHLYCIGDPKLDPEKSAAARSPVVGETSFTSSLQ